MKKLHVHTPGGDYDIMIDKGLFASLPQRLKEKYPDSRFMVVTDENVGRIYGKRLQEGMDAAGASYESFSIPAGESSKRLEMYAELLSGLAGEKFNRADVIVALGGGVTGDLAGFAAATYLRGVRYVQVPTTLLAQIDSAVGGKTAVNLPEGKNLAGAFYQPDEVVVDTDFLYTLEKQDFADGLAEMVKYALIRDEKMFCALEEAREITPDHPKLTDFILRCLMIKRDVVEADERDTGERMILNFGHTIGHGIERAAAKVHRTITHGQAVACGMAAITRISEDMGLTDKGTYARIINVLKKAGLPCTVSGMDRQKIIEGILVDKKNIGTSLNLIVIKRPGKVFIRPIGREKIGDYVHLEEV